MNSSTPMNKSNRFLNVEVDEAGWLLDPGVPEDELREKRV